MRNSRLFVTIALALATLLPSLARAEDKDKDKDKAPPPPIVTDHEIKLAGSADTLKYKATTGKLPLKDDNGKTKAEVFYIAYEKAGVDNAAARPITFAFNGGPGSSSVWLHMGALGPRVAPMAKMAEFPRPPQVWWTTIHVARPDRPGLHRPRGHRLQPRRRSEKTRKFHGRPGTSTAWASSSASTYPPGPLALPSILVGESYGTTRASGLATLSPG